MTKLIAIVAASFAVAVPAAATGSLERTIGPAEGDSVKVRNVDGRGAIRGTYDYRGSARGPVWVIDRVNRPTVRVYGCAAEDSCYIVPDADNGNSIRIVRQIP